MATTELHKVPDTILSRCQHFEFRQISTEKIFQRLLQIANNESIKITDSALREIARSGAGSLRDAQSAFDQVIAFSGAEITEAEVSASLGLVSTATLGNFAEAIANRDTLAMLNLVEDIYSRGYDLRNFSRDLIAYLRHLLVVKSGLVSSEILNVTDVEIDRLKQLASLFSEEDLVRFFHLLAETEKEIKDSPHPRFQLEIGLVKLTHSARLRTLDELIKRLEALQSRLDGGTGSASSGVANQPVTESTQDRSHPPDFPDLELTEPLDLSDSDETISPAPASSARVTKSQSEPAQPTNESVRVGSEVEAILGELQRLNRGLIITALEDAQKLEYFDGTLIVTIGSEDMFARRLRDSSTLFRDLGQRLFGKPLRVEVRISGQVEERIDEEELKRQQLRERAMQSPAVRLILEQTKGEIIWVKEKGQQS